MKQAIKNIMELQDAYLDYVNNYISVLAFAAAYGMTEIEALRTIECGKTAHEAYAAWVKNVGAAKV